MRRMNQDVPVLSDDPNYLDGKCDGIANLGVLFTVIGYLDQHFLQGAGSQTAQGKPHQRVDCIQPRQQFETIFQAVPIMGYVP